MPIDTERGSQKKIRRTGLAVVREERLHSWIELQQQKGLRLSIEANRVDLILPSKMNFSSSFEETTLYLTVIRRLTEKKIKIRNILKLASVDFSNLVELSTSAAIVLTAEMSKWDDGLKKDLNFAHGKWNPEIIDQLYDLGYFDLFKKNPFKGVKRIENFHYDAKLVPYVKGKCGDSRKARILKKEIINLVGDTVEKWKFLHGGLTEAVTNVSHHAYPDIGKYSNKDKNWYLGGSYDEKKKTLKIVFYDQGIGIPKSLPASKIREKVLQYLSNIPIIERKKDAVLLKAAVEIDRTSTEHNDRGKGLQDLLEFINQRENGYLSIISAKGLYKYSLKNGSKKVKSESFANSLLGTLIIWSVSLGKK